MLSVRDYMLKLELELMAGSGRWIADFVESFWGYRVGAVNFGLYVHGGMRPKGYALSRLVARFAMPDYLAACYVHPAGPSVTELTPVLRAVRQDMLDRELKWSWLVFPGDQPFSPKSVARVERNDLGEVGIALVDLSDQTVVTNQSVPGRRMGRFVGCFK